MKNFIISLFLGCCVIGLCVIISGVIIAYKLPETESFPNDISVSTTDAEPEFKDFLSEYEVAAYLSVGNDEVTNLIQSGEITAFATKFGDSYVFSKVALEDWMNSRKSQVIFL
ncbi:MAG TPA: hypothetical protein DDW34_12245 [Clostridium sp.]|nr:hypothetical protein [Clostridium sp.]